jgi:hypothetical protein
MSQEFKQLQRAILSVSMALYCVTHLKEERICLTRTSRKACNQIIAWKGQNLRTFIPEVPVTTQAAVGGNPEFIATLAASDPRGPYGH